MEVVCAGDARQLDAPQPPHTHEDLERLRVCVRVCVCVTVCVWVCKFATFTAYEEGVCEGGLFKICSILTHVMRLCWSR
jgi:hypothetical protein